MNLYDLNINYLIVLFKSLTNYLNEIKTNNNYFSAELKPILEIVTSMTSNLNLCISIHLVKT